MILFNSVVAFEEQVGRRQVQRFGQTVQYTFVYIGPQSAYASWLPQLGSPAPGYPLLYLNNIEATRKEAGILEVSLSYLGTDQQGVTYTDLQITTDLAQKSFSWSGLAKIASAITPYIAQLSIEFTYVTIEVTFSYTTYQYQNGAIFQSQASAYVEIVSAYIVTSYGSTQVGVGPSIGPPYHPMMTLTRYTCEQQTPVNQAKQGIWKCSESWSLNYNMGTLGFPQPNYTPQ